MPPSHIGLKFRIAVLLIFPVLGLSVHGEDAVPAVLKLKLNKTKVHPGRMIVLQADVPPYDKLGSHTFLDVDWDRVAIWEPIAGRMVGLIAPMDGRDSSMQGRFTFSSHPDPKRYDQRTFTERRGVTEVGWSLVSVKWTADTAEGSKTLASLPELIYVMPREDARGRLAVKQWWQANDLDDLKEFHILRRFPIGFTASLSEQSVTPGTAITMTAPGGPFCIDALRIIRFDPKLGAFVKPGVPRQEENVDPVADLGYADAVEKGKPSFRPKYLGVYLLFATRVEADGKTRTTSQPMLLTVAPPTDAAGKPIVKPEWLPPAQNPKDFEIYPACEKAAGLPRPE